MRLKFSRRYGQLHHILIDLFGREHNSLTSFTYHLSSSQEFS